MTLPPWRTISLFVSSTFEDMHAERDHLQQVVFPALAEWLRERRVNLETTDLRWGVETMSIAEQKAKELAVLKVCMAEIDRSRPFMIVLLGDRYGWEPPAERVQRAVREAGFEIDDGARSVTALEIAYGLRHGSRPMRPRFYFREPLPYAQMPADVARRYSDEPAAPDRFGRLARLKQALRAAHPDRVRAYAAAWNQDERRPVGLEAFGEQVLADLHADLLAESGGESSLEGALADPEALALDTFVEERARDAQGRDALLDELAGHALDESGHALAVLVAEPGAGKSVVFARLVRRLGVQADALVLVHAAGVTPASLSVGAMLRRWCAQLQAVLGPPEADLPAAGEALQRSFAALLSRAAATRRVVLLIDALDQFERTPEARHLTWLPHEWPANARLLATTNEGTERGALVARGAHQVELSPLTPAETAAISTRLCARWHKVLPQAVDDALRARPAAARNPLWLSLAVGELLLLDADDFASARGGEGTPEERILRLLVGTVQRLPEELPGAYGAVFERVEQTYGRDIVAAVLRRLALARFGLRESDLQAMFWSHPAWNGTVLATLRRALRAHVGERGAARQWTYTHEQGRQAALARYCADPALRRAEEAAIARHLQGLPEGEPMRHEILHHLAEAGDAAEARDYWRRAPHGDELSAAYEVLRQRVLGPAGDDALGMAAAFLQPGDGDTEAVLGYLAGQRLLEFGEVARVAEAAPARAAALLSAMDAALRPRRDAMAEEVRYRALQNLGLLQSRQGDDTRAARTLAEAGEINARHVEGRRRALEQATTADPKEHEALTIFYHQCLRDRMLNLQRLGGVQQSAGAGAEARASLESALDIARHFVATYPKSPLGATDLASSSYLLADLLFDGGETEAALAHWQAGLDAVQPDLGGADGLLTALRINGHRGMGRGQARQLRLRAALQHRAQAMALADDAAAQDPGNATLQWQFLIAAEEAADTLALAHAPAMALRCWDRSLGVCAAMAHAGLVDVRLMRRMVDAHRQRALALELLGDDAAAGAAVAEAGRYATLLEPAAGA